MLLEEWQLQISQHAQAWPHVPQQLPDILTGNEEALHLLGSNCLLETAKSVESLYPKTCTVLTKSICHNDLAWHAFLQKFLESSLLNSHKINIVLSGFYQFLAKDHVLKVEYPWLADLARFEWFLDSVFASPDISLPGGLIRKIPTTEDFPFYGPVVNQTGAFMQSYFPILQIHEEIENGQFDIKKRVDVLKEITDLWIYRDPTTLRPKVFSFGSRVSRNLFALCIEGGTYACILEKIFQIESCIQDFNIVTVEQNASAFFSVCLESNMLLGSVSILEKESRVY